MPASHLQQARPGRTTTVKDALDLPLLSQPSSDWEVRPILQIRKLRHREATTHAQLSLTVGAGAKV